MSDSLNQTFANGTLSDWYGASGFLQTLRGIITGTEVSEWSETIDATPNGILTAFSGTAANNPIALGRFRVKYTVGAVDYYALDDGSGTIVDESASGKLNTALANTIDYTTGDWVLNFSTAPDNSTNIYGAYIYGEPGADWKELVYRNTTDSTGSTITDTWSAGDCKEWIIQNRGLAGEDYVTVGMREFYDSANSRYGLQIAIWKSYPDSTPTIWNYDAATSGLSGYNNTYDVWTQLPSLPGTKVTAPSTYEYWIYSNRQRIIVILDRSRWEGMYLGFGRRFGAASEYPNPGIAKASAYSYLVAPGDLSNDWAMGPNQSNLTSYHYTLHTILPDNSYQHMNQASIYNLPCFYPTASTSGHTTHYNSSKTLTSTPSGHLFMQPIFVMDQANKRILMDLDGLYGVPSDDVSVNDIVKGLTKKHRVFLGHADALPEDYFCVTEATTTTTSTTTSSTSTSSTSSTSTTTAP